MKVWRGMVVLGLLATMPAALLGCQPTPKQTAEKTPPLAVATIAEARAEPAKANITDTRQLVRSLNAFSLDLFAEMDSTGGGKDDIVASPASAALGLGMAQQGARGETAEQFAKVLGTPLDRASAGQGFADLIGSLGQADRVKIANSMWVQSGLRLKPRFVQADRDYFGAELTALDLAHPDAADRINAWIGDATGGRIEKVLDGLPSQTVLVLVNAIRFDGRWVHEFDKTLTKPRAFRLGDGRTVDAPTMEQSFDEQSTGSGVPYLETDTYQAVELGCLAGASSMFVFLPKAGHDVSDVARTLSDQDWDRLEASFRRQYGRLRLPRFRTMTDAELIPHLRSLGLQLPFDRQHADLSGTAEVDGPLWIDLVKHAAEVEVDEKGTVASAATTVREIGADFHAGPDPFTMDVDRPFLFVLVDDTGLVLFEGIIRDPR